MSDSEESRGKQGHHKGAEERKDWDYASKKLVYRNPQVFLDLFFPGEAVKYLHPLPVEMKAEEFELDCPFLVEVHGEERGALLELQTRNDREMGERLLLYLLL